MRIWILQAYDQPDGQSSRSHTLASKFAGAGHDVTFFTNSYCHFLKFQRREFASNHLLETMDGFSVVWLKTKPYKSAFGRLVNMVENFTRIMVVARTLEPRPDVIITPSVPPLTALAGLLLGRRFRSKLIYEIRDVWPAALVDTKSISRWNPLFWLFDVIENAMYRRSDLVVSTLSKVHDHVVEKGGSMERILIVPNGIDRSVLSRAERMSEDESRELPRLADNPDTKVVLYVGGYGIDHDVMTLVKAAELLRDEAGIRFHCFGDGSNKQRCTDYARRAGLTNIEFHDPIPKDQIMGLQSSAHVLYAGITDSPSYRFGVNLNKLMYYVASGKPIVFSGNEVPQFLHDHGIASIARSGDAHGVAKGIKAACHLSGEEKAKQKAAARKAFESAIDVDQHVKRYLKAISLLID